MNKNYRVEIANKTLEIIKNGFYEYKGKKIDIKKRTRRVNKKYVYNCVKRLGRNLKNAN
ncbi:hypothetical protein AAFH68_43200 [Flavobacterium sp. CGRL1]